MILLIIACLVVGLTAYCVVPFMPRIRSQFGVLVLALGFGALIMGAKHVVNQYGNTTLSDDAIFFLILVSMLLAFAIRSILASHR